MPPKTQTPAPIDRPLSKAYLREFSGWSTAYPPGLSDPTSLRLMENVLINKDGSARVRPGLRYLSYADPAGPGNDPADAITETCVGTHEVFYLNDGRKAYLFAVRETNNTVGFRILLANGSSSQVYHLTDTIAPAGSATFSIPQGEAQINFTSGTTYVKYLQIDNKIFALSNNGEAMREFEVGGSKIARVIPAITRPDYNVVGDKLQIRHPAKSWADGTLVTTRTNMAWDPGMSAVSPAAGYNWRYLDPELFAYNDGRKGLAAAVTTPVRDGLTSVRLQSGPSRTNHALTTLPTGGSPDASRWSFYTSTGAHTGNYTVVGDAIRLNRLNGSPGGGAEVRAIPTGPTPYTTTDVVGGRDYHLAGDFSSQGAPFPASNDHLYFVVYWFDAAGSLIGSGSFLDLGSLPPSAWTRLAAYVVAPSNAAKMRWDISITSLNGGSILPAAVDFRNLVVTSASEANYAFFDGASGTDYSWQGTAGLSPSYYWPPQNAILFNESTTQYYSVSAGAQYTASNYMRCSAVGKTGRIDIIWLTSGGAVISTSTGTPVSLTTSSWTRVSITATAPATAARAIMLHTIPGAVKGDLYYIDDTLFEAGNVLGTWFDGDQADTANKVYDWTNPPPYPPLYSPSTEKTYASPATMPPTAATPTDNTLISDGSPNVNDWNFGFFYSFENQVGESAMSSVTVIKTQRGWSEWKWEQANANSEPNGVAASDPYTCADRLVAYMPEDVFNDAIVNKATNWNLYMFYWSDQGAVPVQAVKVGEKSLNSGSLYVNDGWIMVTPQSGVFDDVSVLPAPSNLFNYSDPSKGGQGLVAADRMVIVKDPTQAARIVWSSNQQGEYTNFSASQGGGYKTLTSGNLFLPACVKLWQNPQSVDTLTILCMGADGHSTGYYMAPAEVTSQSDSTTIMGFEETTATPGTCSPYGCEVFNNTLFHPLDDLLMKSTAANYNINHKSLTDQIENKWTRLRNKHRIVSSQLDQRLYYIVDNPDGEALVQGANGNELWVFDAETDASTWSRYLIQGVSLRKIEVAGYVYMSVVCPDGIYYLDPLYTYDDYVKPDHTIGQRSIPWKLETNTQGANRAHDAWCRLQQLQINLGNFFGVMRWGIRSWDVHGKPIEISKITRDGDNHLEADFLLPPNLSMPFDLEDQLQIRRDLKEWFFFAESINDEDTGDTEHSAGQIDFLQYRYAPVSVNVGYEYGSVESFEYARTASEDRAGRTSDNGVPIPVNDQRWP